MPARPAYASFRFVTPSSKKGEDYDFELFYPDGLTVPADAKCKFESTAINPESVRNSLKKARTQLPADRPGIIFVKVPQHWVSDVTTAVALASVARDFLRSTHRIVSVKFYVSHLDVIDNMLRHRHAYREITNRGSKYNAGRKWDLFKDYPVPASWNGMPPKWQRLFFFPKSGPEV
jgi:hypothetical protein